jgi:hypothetical protein
MFYDALGELLAYAGQALSAEVRPYVSDDRARTQLDAVVALCADIGTMWPNLFGALAAENRILEQALGEDRDSADELGRYRALLAQLNAQLDDARTLPISAASERLEALRAALSASATVQAELVQSAASSGPGVVKRV